MGYIQLTRQSKRQLCQATASLSAACMPAAHPGTCVQFTEMKSVAFAYIHWTVGRAALVFGLANAFFGIGRYRIWFGLGLWAEALLGMWIAVLILVGSW